MSETNIKHHTALLKMLLGVESSNETVISIVTVFILTEIVFKLLKVYIQYLFY